MCVPVCDRKSLLTLSSIRKGAIGILSCPINWRPHHLAKWGLSDEYKVGVYQEIKVGLFLGDNRPRYNL